MASFYKLLIKCNIEQFDQLNLILQKQSCDPDLGWHFIIEENSKLFTEALNIFTNMISENVDKLQTIGIQPSMISFWYMYEYEQQCNMEFLPQLTKKIGDLGVVLCVSCWEK